MDTNDHIRTAKDALRKALGERSMPPRKLIPLASQDVKGSYVREAYWEMRAGGEMLQDPDELLRLT